ncbi:MAG TPA: excinuclease ABC subunit UvrC [Planctomycetota bacterium]|nr:excinuclease ABC subunit UvrC [Planctomycetota bacterium]
MQAGPRLTTPIEDVPSAPGCYIFRSAGGDALYVGKAKDLRARVRSYLREGGDGRPLVPFLARKAERVETIVTATEAEAFLLEDTLIKKLKPTYNLRLKDDKAFLLLRLDPAAEWPRFEWVRRRRADRALYFGPYASAGALRRTMRFLHSVIPMRDCSDAVLANRSRPCLKHAIGRCMAPCVGLISKDDYRALVDRAIDVLRGKTEHVETLLETQMRQAAERLEFERAAAVRDRLDALRQTTEEQGVRLGRALDRDAIGLAREGGRVAIQWLPFRGGRLESGHVHVFSTELPDAEVMSSLLTQLFRGDRFVPREIFLSHAPNDEAAVAQWLSSRRGSPVTLAVPRSGDARRAVELAVENARVALAAKEGAAATAREALERLRERLALPETPSVVDCFDISTLQGRATVASRVRFVDGLPDKSGYRRYKVTSFTGQDDFAAMKEVVGRALRRDVEDDTLPDLVVIDGGKGQLAAALAAKEDSGAFDVAMIALAKDKLAEATDSGAERLGERVFVPGASDAIPLPERTAERHLLERVRDEAHRFAIGYHRKVRGRLTSELDAVAGVGATRRRALLRAFGSLTGLRSATTDQILERLPGFPRELAARVVAALAAPPKSD